MGAIHVIVAEIGRSGGCPGCQRRQGVLYRALMGEACSPTGEECFVTRKFGDILRRLTGKGNREDAKMGVFGGVVVGIPVGELRAEVLDLLLSQLKGAYGLFMFFLLAREGFCAFRTP